MKKLDLRVSCIFSAKHMSPKTCQYSRLRLKCDGTRMETGFLVLAKQTNPFELVGGSVRLTTGSRGVCISGINVGYTIFQGSVNSTGYPLHSLVSLHLPSHASPCAITFQLDSNNIGLSFCTVPTNFVYVGESVLVVKYRREGK